MSDPKWIDDAQKEMDKVEKQQATDPDPELETFKSENWLKKTEGSVPDFFE
jgi:hypothetical protein